MDPSEDRPLMAIKKMNVLEKQIFMNKNSGKDLMGTFISNFFPADTILCRTIRA